MWNVQECAKDDWTGEQVAEARGQLPLHQESWTIRFWSLSCDEMKGSTAISVCSSFMENTPEEILGLESFVCFVFNEEGWNWAEVKSQVREATIMSAKWSRGQEEEMTGGDPENT